MPRQTTRHSTLTIVALMLSCGLVATGERAQAVGNGKPLDFGEDSSRHQLLRLLSSAPRGQRIWIHRDVQAEYGPLLRATDSLLYTRRSGSRSSLVELNSRGLRKRSFAISNHVQSAPVIDRFGRVSLVARHGRLLLFGPTLALKSNYRVYNNLGHTLTPGWRTDSALWVAASNNKLIAISLSGAQKTHSLGHGHTISQPMAVAADGSLIACTGKTAQDAKLNRIERTGKLRWQVPVSPCTAAPSIGPAGNILLPMQGRLASFSPRGKQRWSLTHKKAASAVVTAPDGSHYFTTGAGRLRCVTAQGRLRWVVPVGPSRSTPTAPVVGPRGQVYVSVKSGYLMVFSPQGRLRWYHVVPKIGPRLALRLDATVAVLSRWHSLRLIAPPARLKGARPASPPQRRRP